jgi:hypothetical protein
MVVFMSAGPTQSRPTPLREIYSKLGDLKEQTGGPFFLSECDGHMDWPDRGIYIFFTHDSNQELSPVGESTVARIGTVGVANGSSNTLWGRLRQHRGNQRGKYAGGGNHRGSIFRLHVGRALIEREGLHEQYPHWGTKHADWPEDVETEFVREQEHSLEQRVSDYIGTLPFLVLDVPGEPGPKSDRALIEQRLISTFSFYHRTHNLGSDDWLGVDSPKPEIYKSQLWNINHVEGFSDPTVVHEVEEYVQKADPIDVDNEC